MGSPINDVRAKRLTNVMVARTIQQLWFEFAQVASLTLETSKPSFTGKLFIAYTMTIMDGWTLA